MPIYEYICESCGRETEQLQRLSDPPLTECPSCGEHALAKKISAAGFRLKGSGWYETDFKSSNRRNIAGDVKSSEGKAETGSKAQSGKTDGGDASSASKKASEKVSGKDTKGSKASGSAATAA